MHLKINNKIKSFRLININKIDCNDTILSLSLLRKIKK